MGEPRVTTRIIAGSEPDVSSASLYKHVIQITSLRIFPVRQFCSILDGVLIIYDTKMVHSKGPCKNVTVELIVAIMLILG